MNNARQQFGLPFRITPYLIPPLAATPGTTVEFTVSGLAAETEYTFRMLARDDQGGPEKLLAAVDNCDLLIVASPLYVDALPATVVKALDLIAESDVSPPLGMAGILNCGFPEARHCEVGPSRLHRQRVGESIRPIWGNFSFGLPNPCAWSP